jgi:cysteinyl-tRNA synthetase
VSLKIYDTATRSVREFKPITKNRVGIYLCGATVQASPHIGHIRSGVNFDILRRWLIAKGYEVTFIRNVTDIDDKILHKAVHEEIPWWQVAANYEREFTNAYQSLNVLPPTYEPRATGHITQMIELMQKLIDNQIAYAPGNGDVYLEVGKVKEYLKLSNQKLSDLLPSEDSDTKSKKDPKDFALWKAAKTGEPSWPTPWGNGRPGWHLECSAMAHSYLGENFDIHGGGIDLIFPHHENEIAQSKSAGYEFANYWMHNAWVTTAGEKMSKSLGNSLLVKEILKNVRAIELRWYLGSAHYRSMLEFSHAALKESATAFSRIEAFLKRAKEQVENISPVISTELTNLMDEDLAVPQLLAQISEWMKQGNSSTDKKVIAEAAGKIKAALSILGCDPDDYQSQNNLGQNDETKMQLNRLIELALNQRAAARERKDFKAADAIRDEIAKMGINIEDTPNGPRWNL